MIIGTDFIWLHFPKCAGSFTEKLLKKLVPDNGTYLFDPIDTANVIWHQNIQEREKYLNYSLSNKEIICNFRRLPNWIISRICYERERTGQVVSKEAYCRGNFFEQNGKVEHADNYIQKYTKTDVTYWIRVEYLQNDFIKVFSKYFQIDNILIANAFKNRVNASQWNGDISKWFEKDDLATLYSSCPRWAELEMKIYENILV